MPVYDYDYDYTELYYSTPIQVKYYDLNTHNYEGGIAIKSFLIKSNGEMVNIESIINSASIDGIHFDKAIIELDWKDIGQFILS